MNLEKAKQKYAELVIKKGQGIVPNRPIVIRTPVDCHEFVNILTKEAYENGASKVFVEWSDEITTKYRYTYEPIENFQTIEQYQIDKYKHYLDMGASFISISATNPDNLKSVDSEKIMESAKASDKFMKFFSEALMADKNAWTVISVPTKAWSKKVFPGEDSETKLWEAIISAVRCDLEDPITAWEEHLANLDKYAKFLNENRIDKLIFKNKKGTDLIVKLPEKYVFASGASVTQNCNPFVANMPTEEVFSLADKDNVNGVVYSSKPLNYQGKLIDEFYLEFKDGKVINFDAKIGKESLEKLLQVDEGASRIGEVALVSYETPISLSNILFYNTLFDENASCHLALGRAYPTCLEGGSNMSKEELQQNKANDSAIHVDFMFGTSDMNITAILKTTNEEISIFKDGNFNI